ncbi:hypothetical protein AUEXF2481DRAFT_5804 [Aureobasidium subglaciale EXF-2481]|uniref:Pru domain-containing protein n=1 Tax=Aureobasidium subglaciale (strain EXF-2481) TaxID=1043005 RepID=A0A074Z5T3_AURSE|nr:uncharacterized protein AUEXF2481DRAFT_5804 [Aureobasidium subglaciale EXF-2481]KAI5209820.1 hypothetical protein E4T38_02206 [Aureobasidium subglaciale]KAI5228480.1 hypothetical protein E4T40_01985 [Aureobasidium subglaciale]KAI5231909.1 hypothetical protein E4T41_02205 [Aureobasidium subglaciale]KAI5265816.1 hypothetical protein E4T46_01983 [Aureobasidium subglaciale]KEQ94311.1 hypothetical protein AUEXF2481DRAFT_5804 [Aureobasidium subglaciale EXF-2481]
MATDALITFKAGQCDINGKKVKPDATPGYLYLYEEDELVHFCWRQRSAPPTSPELDLIMFPGDATFTPYTGTTSSADTKSPTNGRIYMLKFSSSSQRHFFWLQSKSQHPGGDVSVFSSRDKRYGEIINNILAGEEVDVGYEVQRLRDDDEGGDDVDMEDAQPEHHRQGSGGAGADATGGDPTVEGEASREAGADGGRAAPPSDANDAVQNFLRSLQGSSIGTRQQPQQQQSSYDRPYTTLSELLSTNTTIPWLSSTSPEQIDALCMHLPPSLFLLAQETAASTSSAEPSEATTRAAIEAMATEQKRELLQRVLRSPQLNQSLGSLTFALRDGGLPMVSEALGVKVQNGGMVKHGSVPLGGGEAVEAFVEGVKKGVQDKKLT